MIEIFISHILNPQSWVIYAILSGKHGQFFFSMVLSDNINIIICFIICYSFKLIRGILLSSEICLKQFNAILLVQTVNIKFSFNIFCYKVNLNVSAMNRKNPIQQYWIYMYVYSYILQLLIQQYWICIHIYIYIQSFLFWMFFQL